MTVLKFLYGAFGAARNLMTRRQDVDSCVVPLDELDVICGGSSARCYGRDADGRVLYNYDGYQIERSPETGCWSLVHWSGSTQMSETQRHVMARGMRVRAAIVLLQGLVEVDGKKRYGRAFKEARGPSSLAAVIHRLDTGEIFLEERSGQKNRRLTQSAALAP